MTDDPPPSSSSPPSSSPPPSSASRPTVCPNCAVGCRLEPGATRERASGVAGPANPEGRLCPAGIGAFDVADDRLTRPLLRRDDDLAPVSWATAYEHVVTGFETVLDEHGPEALAFLGAPHSTNEANYLLQKLARTLGTNDVDNRARLCHDATARALSEHVGWPATTNGLDDLGEADVILVAGANPAARQPVAFDGFVRPAVNDGTTLVHLDPVGNETTRLADVHLAPRPGTDAHVFDLLSAHVRDAGGVDHEFVEGRTRGYDGFAADLADFDRETAAATAGIDHDAVARLAETIADADRVAALVGTGVEGAADGPNAPVALLDLLLLTGNLGRRGTGLFVLRGLVNEQGATDAGCVPDRLPGHRPVTDPAAREAVAAEWGVAPPAEPGRTARRMLDSFGDGIRAALVVGENPAISKREEAWIQDRLDALDALVVVDVAPSRTTEHADVVLPSAGVETAGTVTNLDRRVQRVRPTTDPPGAARTDFAILRDLGRRLFDDEALFDYEGPAAVFDELARVAPTHAGLSDADLGPEGRRWPAESDGVLYRTAFATPDGRASFGTTRPVVDSAPERDGLLLVTGGRASELGDARRETDSALRIHPADADDRGIEAGGRVLVSGGETSFGANADLDDGVRRGTVYLPATDADPFLRCGTSTVAVEPRSATDPPR